MDVRDFAQYWHTDQKYGEYPYVKHLDDVYNVLLRYGFTHEFFKTVAYLHDVLEDTKCTFQELKEEFGAAVAFTVERVTNEPGKNRKERSEKTYPKTREDQFSVVLKLADRIANVEESIRTKSPLFKMYKKEFDSFVDGLGVGGPCGFASIMWDDLNKLMHSEDKND